MYLNTTKEKTQWLFRQTCNTIKTSYIMLIYYIMKDNNILKYNGEL